LAFLPPIDALIDVRPSRGPPFTTKSYVTWRRSTFASGGASVMVGLSESIFTTFGSQTSGSTVMRTGRDSLGATTTFGGSNVIFSSAPRFGSQSSPGSGFGDVSGTTAAGVSVHDAMKVRTSSAVA
jgi:hypothetical protein